MGLIFPRVGLAVDTQNTNGMHVKYPVHLVSKDANIDITTKKTADVIGSVDAAMALLFEIQMRTSAAESGDRVIRINSGGGAVIHGQKIINLMEEEKKIGIRQICIVTGDAGSMAFNILTHCDVRLTVHKSRFMFHKIAYGVLTENTEGRLTPKKLRFLARKIEREDEIFRQANCTALHISLSEYDVYADKDTNWTPEKLLSLGYLHAYATLE